MSSKNISKPSTKKKNNISGINPGFISFSDVTTTMDEVDTPNDNCSDQNPGNHQLSNMRKNDTSGSNSIPLYAGSDSELAQHCTKIVKKDLVTRMKAFNEIIALLTNKAELIPDFLPFFAHIYPRLSYENSRQIRETLNKVLLTIINHNKRLLQSYMTEIIGSWWMMCSDIIPEVSSTALKAFHGAIPLKKRPEVLVFLSNQILSNILKNCLQTDVNSIMQELNRNGNNKSEAATKEDAEERYERIIISSIHSLSLFLKMMTPETLQNSTSSEDLFNSLHNILTNLFWDKFVTHNNEFIRRACYELLATISSLCPWLLTHSYKNSTNKEKMFFETILKMFYEKSENNLSIMFDTFISFGKSFSNVWNYSQNIINYLTQLERIITSSPHIIIEYLLTLIALLPAEYTFLYYVTSNSNRDEPDNLESCSDLINKILLLLEDNANKKMNYYLQNYDSSKKKTNEESFNVILNYNITIIELSTLLLLRRIKDKQNVNNTYVMIENIAPSPQIEDIMKRLVRIIINSVILSMTNHVSQLVDFTTANIFQSVVSVVLTQTNDNFTLSPTLIRSLLQLYRGTLSNINMSIDLWTQLLWIPLSNELANLFKHSCNTYNNSVTSANNQYYLPSILSIWSTNLDEEINNNMNNLILTNDVTVDYEYRINIINVYHTTICSFIKSLITSISESEFKPMIAEQIYSIVAQPILPINGEGSTGIIMIVVQLMYVSHEYIISTNNQSIQNDSEEYDVNIYSINFISNAINLLTLTSMILSSFITDTNNIMDPHMIENIIVYVIEIIESYQYDIIISNSRNHNSQINAYFDCLNTKLLTVMNQFLMLPSLLINSNVQHSVTQLLNRFMEIVQQHAALPILLLITKNKFLNIQNILFSNNSFADWISELMNKMLLDPNDKIDHNLIKIIAYPLSVTLSFLIEFSLFGPMNTFAGLLINQLLLNESSKMESKFTKTFFLSLLTNVYDRKYNNINNNSSKDYDGLISIIESHQNKIIALINQFYYNRDKDNKKKPNLSKSLLIDANKTIETIIITDWDNIEKSLLPLLPKYLLLLWYESVTTSLLSYSENFSEIISNDYNIIDSESNHSQSNNWRPRKWARHICYSTKLFSNSIFEKNNVSKNIFFQKLSFTQYEYWQKVSSTWQQIIIEKQSISKLNKITSFTINNKQQLILDDFIHSLTLIKNLEDIWQQNDANNNNNNNKPYDEQSIHHNHNRPWMPILENIDLLMEIMICLEISLSDFSFEFNSKLSFLEIQAMIQNLLSYFINCFMNYHETNQIESKINIIVLIITWIDNNEYQSKLIESGNMTLSASVTKCQELRNHTIHQLLNKFLQHENMKSKANYDNNNDLIKAMVDKSNCRLLTPNPKEKIAPNTSIWYIRHNKSNDENILENNNNSSLFSSLESLEVIGGKLIDTHFHQNSSKIDDIHNNRPYYSLVLNNSKEIQTEWNRFSYHYII
eukprot:gene11191-15011_t